MKVSYDELLVQMLYNLDPAVIISLQQQYVQKGDEAYMIFLASRKEAAGRREKKWKEVTAIQEKSTSRKSYKEQVLGIVKEGLAAIQKKYPKKKVGIGDIYSFAGFEENDVSRYLYNEQHRGHPKYRDAHLRLIFLLEMDYEKAESFTMLVDQKLDWRVKRDFLLMECIAQKKYCGEDVDGYLRKHGEAVLFDY